MADIGPDDLPFVPDAAVALINTTVDETTGKVKGTPTTAFHDWLSTLWSKMKGSLVDLTTKITTLTADIDGLHGEITTEATIRQTQDGILASQITTVSTVANNAQATATSAIGLATSAQNTANNATANGEVYLQAMAGPAGSAAAFGIFLTAGNKFTGLMLVADSSGGSEIVMMSGALRFYDSSSGSLINMLSYSGGQWVLNGNVTLQAADGSGATARWENGHFGVWDGSGQPIALIGLNI